MKHSIDNRFKMAFNEKENEAIDIGINRGAIWQRIQHHQSIQPINKSIIRLRTSAAVLIPLFLIGWGITYLNYRAVQNRNQQLILQLSHSNAQQPETTMITKKKDESEPSQTVLKTLIKEVNSPKLLKHNAELEQQYLILRNNYQSLISKLNAKEVDAHHLQDSLQQLQKTISTLQEICQVQEKALKSKDNNFFIEVNEEALLALKENKEIDANLEAPPQQKISVKLFSGDNTTKSETVEFFKLFKLK
jgi:hypothetical protein